MTMKKALITNEVSGYDALRVKYLKAHREAMRKSEDDFDESGSYFYTIRFPKRWTEANIKDYLKDRYGMNYRCGHSYDCCGCISFYIQEVRHLKRNEWFVHLRWNRNV